MAPSNSRLPAEPSILHVACHPQPNSHSSFWVSNREIARSVTVCVPSVNLLVVKQIREGWWKSLDWPGARRAIIGSKVMGLHEWFGDFLAGSGSR